MSENTYIDPQPRATFVRPNLKKQLTFRLDEKLCDAAFKRAEQKNLHLSDVIENLLKYWVARED